MTNLLYSILDVTPKYLHNEGDYQLEKIFGYLNSDNQVSPNYFWGLEQAKEFAENLGSKWVIIDTQTMEAEEIKLLVRVACYLEAEEKGRNFIQYSSKEIYD